MSINHVSSVIILLTLSILTYSSISSLNVYAEQPSAGYSGSQTCAAPTTLGSLTKKTCCWKDYIVGKLPPNNKANYCQTCTVDTKDVTLTCDPPVKQFQKLPDSIPLNEFQENPSPPLGTVSPLQKDSVLENSFTKSTASSTDNVSMPSLVQNTPSDSETSQLGNKVNEDDESKDDAANDGISDDQ